MGSSDELTALLEEYNNGGGPSGGETADEDSYGGESASELDDAELGDELLRLEQLNQAAAPVESAPRAETKGTVRLLSALHRQGERGAVEPAEFAFLSPFALGLEPAWAALKEQASELLKQADEEMKSPVYKKLNKQKPIKQRIKQTVGEKTKQMSGGYEDTAFVLAQTKDFGYRTGIKIHLKKRESAKPARLEKNPVHENMQGFYTPVQPYPWDSEKITEFIACIFSG